MTRADDEVFSRSSLNIGLQFLLLFRRRLELLFHLHRAHTRVKFHFPFLSKKERGRTDLCFFPPEGFEFFAFLRA